MTSPDSATPRSRPFDLDLDALLHPAQAFKHPRDVVGDLDLTLNEKRAILASWASDACAVEAAPALRHVPGADRPVPVDENPGGFAHARQDGERAGSRIVQEPAGGATPVV